MTGVRTSRMARPRSTGSPGRVRVPAGHRPGPSLLTERCVYRVELRRLELLTPSPNQGRNRLTTSSNNFGPSGRTPSRCSASCSWSGCVSPDPASKNCAGLRDIHEGQARQGLGRVHLDHHALKPRHGPRDHFHNKLVGATDPSCLAIVRTRTMMNALFTAIQPEPSGVDHLTPLLGQPSDCSHLISPATAANESGPDQHCCWSGPVPAVSMRAPEGIRTPNLLIRSQVLYPLSYGRVPPVRRSNNSGSPAQS